MGEVGLALTVPLCSGTMIIAACLLARLWLHEGVTPRSALALALLITAIVVLSLGAERAPQLAELATADASITAALSAACLSGVCYAVLNVTIRRLITRSMPMPIILSTVSSVGVVSLGLAAIARTGWEPLAATELTDLGVMFIAGTFNAVAFFALTKALQLVSIVQVNARQRFAIGLGSHRRRGDLWRVDDGHPRDRRHADDRWADAGRSWQDHRAASNGSWAGFDGCR